VLPVGDHRGTARAIPTILRLGHPPPTTTLTPATDNHAVLTALYGKVPSGIGGISSDSEVFNINFKDGGAIWFITEGSTPRVLIKK
jgi:hypothetical protein